MSEASKRAETTPETATKYSELPFRKFSTPLSNSVGNYSKDLGIRRGEERRPG